MRTEAGMCQVSGYCHFILKTYARFRGVFNARKRPAEPFETDIGGRDGVVCALHKPRRMAVG